MNRYMNPYLAGFLLGLVLLASIVITGRGLGASGAVKGVVTGTVLTASPQAKCPRGRFPALPPNQWHSSWMP